jgi:biopolymer transport protein TolR
MPSIAPRGGSRRRRSMNEINMVPFIDVMLVLLIIFMVSAPMITTGLVDLPTVGKAKARPTSVIEIVVGADERLRMRVDAEPPEAVRLNVLADTVKSRQRGDDNIPVVISADKAVRYEQVVRVMDVLQRAGVPRVGLSVKQGG